MSDVKRISLCPECEACPEVVFEQDKNEVRIGEDKQWITLKKEAWDVLVKKIRDGELIPL